MSWIQGEKGGRWLKSANTNDLGLDSLEERGENFVVVQEAGFFSMNRAA